MPRAARIVIPDCPHHLTQRGNNRQDVFFVDDDRRYYLDTLAEAATRFALRIDGYCLMTNHLHLIATPATPDALAQTMSRTNLLYTQYVNRLHGRSGHLWQDRFFSCPLDEEHFWRALAYVERNPVRAKIVRRAWRWPWSSAAAHCGMGAAKAPPGLLDLTDWPDRIDAKDWQESLTEPPDPKHAQRLRLCASRGRPLGSDRFIAKLERLIGRRLRPLPRGRPPKQKNPTTQTQNK